MYFRRPLADAPHAGLAIPALARELFGHPVAAVDLDGRVDHAAQHLARIELGDGSLDARILPAVGLPGALPDDQRHARNSTSASASIHWMAWRWLSGCPKVERCLAWAMAMRCAATATPRLHAEYGKRFFTSRSK